MLSAVGAISNRPSFFGSRIWGRKPMVTPIRTVSISIPKAPEHPRISLITECSSRPRKKATAHHVKSRPKKHQPYDKNRKGPTKYPPLPRPPLKPSVAVAVASPDNIEATPDNIEEEKEKGVEEEAPPAVAAPTPVVADTL